VKSCDKIRCDNLFLPDLHRIRCIVGVKELEPVVLERMFIRGPGGRRVTSSSDRQVHSECATSRLEITRPCGPSFAWACCGLRFCSLHSAVHFSLLSHWRRGAAPRLPSRSTASGLGVLVLKSGLEPGFECGAIKCLPCWKIPWRRSCANWESVCTTIPVQTRTKPTSKTLNFLQGIAIVVMIFGVLAWQCTPAGERALPRLSARWPSAGCSLDDGLTSRWKFNRLMGSTCRQRIGSGTLPFSFSHSLICNKPRRS